MLVVNTEKIKSIRTELGLTQKELAEKAGLCSKSSICKMEKRSEGWTLSNVNKIVRALGVNPILLIKQV